jgi:hypothetical protein
MIRLSLARFFPSSWILLTTICFIPGAAGSRRCDRADFGLAYGPSTITLGQSTLPIKVSIALAPMRPISIGMTSEYKRQEEPLTRDSDKHSTLCRVPVFRPVAVKLMQLLGNEEASVHEVSELLSSDPGFSAEMLTMANSAAHGGSHRIHTIERAVVLLGLERTKGLATKAALDGMVRGLGASPTIQNCWRHSLATALIAKWLAPFYRLHPDLVYTTGLMHDVGRLGLLAAEPKQYSTVVQCRGDQ